MAVLTFWRQCVDRVDRQFTANSRLCSGRISSVALGAKPKALSPRDVCEKKIVECVIVGDVKENPSSGFSPSG